MRNKEEEVILAFVAHLAQGANTGLKVERWPDREKDTPRTERIDAIAGQFAIEHTSIDALDEKRARDPQFMEAIGKLENELRGQVPFHLMISIRYGAIEKGQNWSAMRQALRQWITRDAHQLSDGNHQIDVGLDGVPVRLHVWKRPDLGGAHGLYFSRMIDDPDVTLQTNVSKLVREKARKLLSYGRQEKERVLLVEGNDIAMLGHIVVAEAIEAAFPEGLPEGIDAIWYADTTLGVENVRFYNLTDML